MHAQMKHSLANLKDSSLSFDRNNYVYNKQHKPAKGGIKSCGFARECGSFAHT